MKSRIRPEKISRFNQNLISEKYLVTIDNCNVSFKIILNRW